jgi:hypothetical protein
VKAGPFDLGNVLVRVALFIDPHTAQVTVVSDPLPTILDGIQLDVRTINVVIDRRGFTFNPTNCEPMSVTGTIASAEGASSYLSVPFQVANCNRLQTITSNSLKQNEEPQRKKEMQAREACAIA